MEWKFSQVLWIVDLGVAAIVCYLIYQDYKAARTCPRDPTKEEKGKNGNPKPVENEPEPDDEPIEITQEEEDLVFDIIDAVNNPFARTPMQSITNQPDTEGEPDRHILIRR